jgi:DnaJ-class molecular chaperone
MLAKCKKMGTMRAVAFAVALGALLAVAKAGDENPYDVLGVPRDATTADLKRRFHKMALHFHPDR